jgi:hypothetical protein
MVAAPMLLMFPIRYGYDGIVEFDHTGGYNIEGMISGEH